VTATRKIFSHHVVERASYEASRTERRYMAVDPDNRLVARGLERDWEQRLADLEAWRVKTTPPK
jgi:hypothetical protein